MGKEVLSSGCPRRGMEEWARVTKGQFPGSHLGKGEQVEEVRMEPTVFTSKLELPTERNLKHFILDYKTSKKSHLLPLNHMRSNAVLLTYKLRRLFPSKIPGLLPFQHRETPVTHSVGRAKPSPWQSSNLWTSWRVKGWSPRSWLNDLVKDTGESVVIT